MDQRTPIGQLQLPLIAAVHIDNSLCVAHPEHHMRTQRLIFFLGVLVVVTPTSAEGAKPRIYSVLDSQDLSDAAKVLRRRVAYVDAKHPIPEGQPLLGGQMDGWSVVTDTHEIICQALLVAGAEDIWIQGPKGRTKATITVLNRRLRWARLRTQRPIHELGLEPAPPSPAGERKVGMHVFALVSTRPGSGVITGVLTEEGVAEHLEGHPRTDLKLVRGMPVFDEQMRWLGVTRASAWDADPFLIIPPEMTRQSPPPPRQSPPPPPKERERPWWAR